MALRGRSKYLIFWSPKERKTGREGEKRKGEEGRRRRGRGRSQDQAKPSSKKVWNYMAFKALNGFPCNCMVISCLQPRVFLGFHPNPIIIESKVDKTIKSTRII